MSYIAKINIANKANYGSQRSTGKIKYLVIHYTGNDGDTDEANTNYFKNNIVKASAHYFIDDDSVTQSVPENYVAWHCGGKKYKSCATSGGGKYYGLCNNANSIGVELCDTKKNGVYDFGEKTLQNATEFCKDIIRRYNIPKSNVIRHFDVVGKTCPAPFVSNTAAWEAFRDGLYSNTTQNTPSSTTITSIQKGDKVKVLVNKQYNGKTFRVYYNTYDVLKVSGDNITIGIGNTATCITKAEYLQKV